MATFDELILLDEIEEIIEDYMKDKQPLKYTLKQTNKARGGNGWYLYTWQYIPKDERKKEHIRFTWKYVGGMHNIEMKKYLLGSYNDSIKNYLDEARKMLKQRDKMIESEMERNGYYQVDLGPEKNAIRIAAGLKIKKKYKQLWRAEEFIEKAKNIISEEKRKFELMEIFKTKVK